MLEDGEIIVVLNSINGRYVVGALERKDAVSDFVRDLIRDLLIRDLLINQNTKALCWSLDFESVFFG